jgi:hypothetical protein
MVWNGASMPHRIGGHGLDYPGIVVGVKGQPGQKTSTATVWYAPAEGPIAPERTVTTIMGRH